MSQSATMSSNDALMQTDLLLPGKRQGKVRDIYECMIGDGEQNTEALVIIASDRVSAFDVVMSNGVPGKGIVLTQISKFWFELIQSRLGDRIGHHLISTDPADIPSLDAAQAQKLRGRVMIGKKTQVFPIECVVRGYITGSGWKDYQKTGAVCGIPLSADLKQCDKLAEPIFTPATKAQTGHDENISFEQACDVAGTDTMTTLRNLSIALYQMAHDHAAERGIILADTKFEFGRTSDGTLLIIDEVFTPDSSRFWPADKYESGRDQESYDKQYVRNYLEIQVAEKKWDKTPPGPILPDDVVRNTLSRYLQAYRALTGHELEM